MNFEWDIKKEEENIKKHGLSFAKAIETFKDTRGIKLIDTKHSDKEERFFWIGKTADGVILTTRFTIRDEKIRIIGCSEWRHMKRLYEETKFERS